jgi:hypothetical protein
LAVFQGSDWIIVHDFNLESDGTPYTVFGTSAEELVVFSYPSSTGGVFISYGDVVSLSLPQFGVTGSNDNGYGVRGITGDLGNGFFAAGWWKKSPEVEESGFVWRSSDLVEWEEMEDVPHVEDSGLFSEHFWDACLDDQGILYVFGDWYDSVATAEGESNAVVLKRDGAEWVVVDLPPIPDAQPGYEKRGVLYGAWCPGRHVFAAGVTYREGTPEMAVLHYTPPEDL